MKRQIAAKEVVDQYIETCLILRETILNGDSKTGNKEYKKL
ncbi:hypothetical protein AGMMS50284_6730 [Clostridia bacterium]|nr:hypothetical protein AGMMS50284_6730 [Clostridia bacterium]